MVFCLVGWFGGGGRVAEGASVSLIFTLHQYLLNKAFYKLVNIYWVPPWGKNSRKGYFIKNYKIFSQSLDLSFWSLSVHIWSKFR